MAADVENLERIISAMGSLEREHEERLLLLTSSIKELRAANRSAEADALADLREETRISLKLIKVEIAAIETAYDTARRRARR